MKHFLVLLMCATIGLSSAGIGYAADGTANKKKTPADVFKKKDTNNDEKLSKQEFTAGLEGQKKEKAETRFGKKDKDSDGFLTLAEFAPAKKAKANKPKQDAPANKPKKDKKPKADKPKQPKQDK